MQDFAFKGIAEFVPLARDVDLRGFAPICMHASNDTADFKTTSNWVLLHGNVGTGGFEFNGGQVISPLDEEQIRAAVRQVPLCVFPIC